MKKILLVLTLLFTTSQSIIYAQSTETFFNDANTFFKLYVSNGKVDYKGIVAHPEALNKLMQQAQGIKVSEKNVTEFQSFWINAYNISVIKGIVNEFPISSPLDKKGFFDKTTYEIAGQKITLNDIENKMLRAKFKDARFHFVLVCGAKGCPPLIAEAYNPSTLEKQLEQQTVKALNNDSFIKASGKKVAISEIFKWYKEDFVRDGNEVDYLNKYRTNKIDAGAKVTYYTYDWRLNAK
ncbi:DUF547 domain-containing protein [Patiriisocius marinus]|uniref:DUF547 domain-containing protein n=1 Tax=Patiriisocius marinus TaxID=1397112 RepID=A0A5J4IWP3_9FLAO|nr:DUF547 domain-containing protein [Patiriisocius marinus]GER58230.1 DUF547 domain-containing protein [Patiriisocius marinus]